MEGLVKTVLSGLVAYGAHYSSVKIYDNICVPDGILGFLRGFVTTGSPMCQVGVTMIKETQTSYSSFFLLGLSRILIDALVPGFNLNNNDRSHKEG
jgi:hypothetical protein